MPGQHRGAHGASSELHLSRSVSVREARGCAAPSEKRRSTSFDETLGELVLACASSLRADCTPEPIKKKKKASLWPRRVWKFSKGIKKEAPPSPSAAPQKEASSLPTWKKLLHMLRSRAKDAHKPAICSSQLDLQVAHCDEPAMNKGEAKNNKPVGFQADRQQRLYSVHPEPIAAYPQSSTSAAPIWERRNVARPTMLDLSNLRVTGLKHLQRPHQWRG